MAKKNVTHTTVGDEQLGAKKALVSVTENLSDFYERINLTRSTVYVCGEALDHQDDDLSIFSARILKAAENELSCLLDHVLQLTNRVKEVANG